MNIREIAKVDQEYYEFCREERNYAAILYALLLHKNNLELFVNEICGITTNVDDNAKVFFEYAYLRDLWHEVKDNNVRFEIIKMCVKKPSIIKKGENLQDASSLKGFNDLLVTGNGSQIKVQSPARWSIDKLKNELQNDEYDKYDEFKDACKLKWAFNCKPDIVIEVATNKVICIETKYESGESVYHVDGTTVKVTQLELLYYMLKELLGNETHMVLISLGGKEVKTVDDNKVNVTVRAWKDVFEKLNNPGLSGFAKEMVDNFLRRTND